MRKPPSSAEIKNGGAILHLPRTSSRDGAKLIKSRDKLIFYIQESLFHSRIQTHHKFRSESLLAEKNFRWYTHISIFFPYSEYMDQSVQTCSLCKRKLRPIGHCLQKERTQRFLHLVRSSSRDICLAQLTQVLSVL